jgi:hypothetical protein
MITRKASAVVLLLTLAACGEKAQPVVVDQLTSAPTTQFAQSADPGLAVDPATGDLLLSFVGSNQGDEWSLYFSRSSDGGQSWNPPVQVATGPGEVHPHGEGAARLVAGPGGRVALLWANSIKVESRKWPATMMRFARSLDGGATWSSPVTINDDTTGALQGHNFQGAAWVGDSGFIAAWLDERRAPVDSAAAAAHAAMKHEMDAHAHEETTEADAMIYSVSSSDFGTTWEANRPLWGAVCPCCRVTLARTPSGGILSAWRKHFPGNVRDIVVAPVHAGMTEPSRVREDNWVYPGCPHTGPSLSLDSLGAAQVAWYTGKPGGAGVYLARAKDSTAFGPAITLLTGERVPTAHPQVAALPGGASLVAWDIDQGGSKRLVVAHVATGATRVTPTVVPGSEGTTYPQLARLGDGSVALAWTQLTGDTLRVGFGRVAGR